MSTNKETIQHRVLVVEDDEGWIKLSKIRLEKQGFLVGTANTRDAAIEQLDRCLYHAAIVDLKLDENNPNDREGLRVLEYIWRMNEGTRAIVRSGFASEISVINEMITYGIKGLTEKDLSFVKESANKESATDKEFFKAIESAAAEAQMEIQHVGARTVWESSPFGFMNGILARDIQMNIGGGRMSELRGLLGDLVEACAPWLQAINQNILKPIEIKDNDEVRIIGYQTICWSRTLGDAFCIRFGRKDYYEKGHEKHPVQKLLMLGKIHDKLWENESLHFKGEVYMLKDVNFRENFRRPIPKRTIEH